MKFNIYILLIIVIASCRSSPKEGFEKEASDRIIYAQEKMPMPTGHKVVRDLLGTDIGEMRFDTKEAIDFKTYLRNSILRQEQKLLYLIDNSIQFCADGSFTWTIVHFQDWGLEGETDVIPGYWDVAVLPNNLLIIVLYSTDPNMLEESSNGFMPWLIVKYDDDFMEMPANAGRFHRGVNACEESPISSR